jgi:hypothetical protein
MVTANGLWVENVFADEVVVGCPFPSLGIILAVYDLTVSVGRRVRPCL